MAFSSKVNRLGRSSSMAAPITSSPRTGRMLCAARASPSPSLVAAAAGQQCPGSIQEAPQATGISRRDHLMALSLAAIAASSWSSAPPAQALMPKPASVSNYLKPTPDQEGFFTYVPPKDATPALRSGAIGRPYTINLPGNWREERVANIKNGNYCQPKCGEPYTESVFEADEDGRVEILNVPMFKLTPRGTLPIEQIGTPDNILPRIGPYVTGTAFEDEDLVASSTKVLDEGRTYYYYEIYAPYGTNGAHSYTAVTARGDLVFVVFATASEKQWKTSEAKLRTIVNSFRP